MSNGIGTLTRAICRLPGAIDSRALQLCNECPRSRGASAPLTASHGHPPGRGSGAPCLCFVFFFFFLQHPNFCNSDPRLAPRTGSCRLVGCGVGVGVGVGGSCSPRKVTEDASRGRGVGGSQEERAGGARGGMAAPTHPRTRLTRGTRSPSRPRAASAARRVHDTQTDPDRKRPVFSDDGCVFRVAAGAPGVAVGGHFPACLAGPTSRRASRCPGRSREEGLLPAVSAAATWGRGGRKAAEEKSCVCVCF